MQRTCPHLKYVAVVVAGITNAKSIPWELMAIVLNLPYCSSSAIAAGFPAGIWDVPVFKRYHWVMETVLYEDHRNVTSFTSIYGYPSR